MTLATKIAVMDGGIIQQFAEPQAVYERPANTFVATFMGTQPMNFVPARVMKSEARTTIRLTNANGADDELPVQPGALAASLTAHR